MTFLQNVAIITLVIIFEAIVVFLSIFFTCELNKPYKYVSTAVLVSLNLIALGIVVIAWANGFVFPLN